jgi:hypothetical protein
MFQAVLAHHQAVQLLNEMFAWYIGALHVADLLEILQYA